MDKKKVKRDMQRVISQYQEAIDFAKTPERIKDILTKLDEVKAILERLETLHQLSSMVELFEHQNWLFKEYLTLDEVASYLDISRSTVRRMSSQRIFPVYKPMDRILIKKEELIQWIEKGRFMSQQEIVESARRTIEETKKNKIKRSINRIRKRK